MIYSQCSIQALHNCKKFDRCHSLLLDHTFTLLLMVLAPPGVPSLYIGLRKPGLGPMLVDNTMIHNIPPNKREEQAKDLINWIFDQITTRPTINLYIHYIAYELCPMYFVLKILNVQYTVQYIFDIHLQILRVIYSCYIFLSNVYCFSVF